MKNIKVKLLSYSETAGVLNAIGKPYRNENASIDLIKKICVDENFKEKHGSVLEHVYMTFEIIGVSRGELQEHMRHRMASPTVESSRFTLKKIMNSLNEDAVDTYDTVEEEMESYFVYPFDNILEGYGYDKDQITEYKENLSDIYANFCDVFQHLKDEVGIKHNDLLKYILPEGFRTGFTWTINLRSLRNFLKLRLDEGAHFEIRHVAKLLLESVENVWIKELI